MIGKFSYTDKEMKLLLDSMVILVDTRENQWQHIEDYFIKKKVSYKVKKLDFADFSLMVPKNEQLQIMRDIYFTDNIVIERKAHLNEISGNLTADGGSRFESELIRSKGAKFYLMIENASYADIINHNYNTQYDPKAFVARLKTFESRFGIDLNFVNSKCSGNFIYHTFYYWLREQLKKGELLHDSATMRMPDMPESS